MKQGKKQQLMNVGFQEPLAYARSLSTFASSLGPVASTKASKRIESSLSEGLTTSAPDRDRGLRFDGFTKNGTPLMNSSSEASSSSPWRTPVLMLHQHGGNGVAVGLTESKESRNGVINHPVTTTTTTTMTMMMMMKKQMEGVSDSKCPSNFQGSELRTRSTSSSHQPDLALQL
ncbi:hypothetical protein M569_01895 [Genlisea aurea]|uniref:Uncharacterized protein n=1 Tax=Genlisea aurea TaxID=192259 RepID=S8D0J2_9LAMI|nr:hypothetical protein M569_01895 [Genlisea aurea]